MFPKRTHFIILYFGFFLRKDLEGDTPLNGLTGFTEPFFGGTFVFDGMDFIGFFEGTAFLPGTALPLPEDAFDLVGNAFFTFADDFADFDDEIGFTGCLGLLAADFTGIGFLMGFFGGLAGAFFGTGLGTGFGSDADLAGFFTGVSCLGDSCLGTLSVVLTGIGSGVTAFFGEGGGVKIGEVQLRLTASGSIALNCDSNSGESGTS